MYTNAESLVGKDIEQYRLTRVLGAGATSTVFEAHRVSGADQQPEVVAVKVLLPQYAGINTESKEATRRFLREARAAKQLTHPHILPVLTFGETDGHIYMILPLVAAGTLSTWLSTQSEPLPLRVVADILRQTADALDFAHSQGIIHRDIKPSNLLRDADGTVYLTDFGVARVVATDNSALIMTAMPDQAALTQTGEALGTPYYMAPEQIRGEAVGPETDVYALGIVLFLLVTGQLPFQGDTPLAVALQHLQEEPCPPHLLRTDLPEGVEEVMLKALAKEPGDRYASAGALARDFSAQVALTTEDEDSNATLQGVLTPTPGAESEALGPGVGLVGETIGDYTLEEHLASDNLGHVFRARTAPSGPRYRLRVLSAGDDADAELSDDELRQLAHGTQGLLGLRHPGLVPAVDAGVAGGSVYVVSPQPAGLTVDHLLRDLGALDLDAVDGYLTQVAALLDWAHSQKRLHGNLSPTNVYVDERGTAQVADLGLRQLYEAETHPAAGAGGGPSANGSLKSPLLVDEYGASPEQVLGKPTEPASDVYALGCLLYQMLAGRPVFDGATPEDVAQQHLYSTPTTLRRVRTGLPSALQNILNRALAKDPRQRYAKPSDLARAYHEILTRAALGNSQSISVPVPLGSRVAASLSRGSTGLSQPTGPTGMRTRELGPEAAETQIASLPPMRSQRTADAPPATATAFPAGASTTVAPSPITPPPMAAYVAPAPPAIVVTPNTPTPSVTPVASSTHTPPPAGPVAIARQSPPAEGNGSRRRLPISRLVLGAVTVLVLAGLAFVLVRALAPTPQATVDFTDNTHSQPGLSDSVTVSVQSLPAPANGTVYYAWILDNSNESSQILGQLVKHGDTYSLQFSQKGVAPLSMLVGSDTLSIQVTAEPDAQVPVHWPRGKTVLQVSIPAASFLHVGHLLVSFPETPGKIGLLVGLLDQSQRLDAQALALQDDVQKGNTAAYTCEAQSIIDIIEGSKGPSYAPLSQNCINAGITEVGDGYGILGKEGYNAGVADHANLAATAPGATDATKTHAHGIAIAVANLDDWANDADHAAWWLLHHPSDTSGVTALVTSCTYVYSGHNPSGSGLAQPLPGQAGAQTAYHEGQLMATLTLTQPGS